MLDAEQLRLKMRTWSAAGGKKEMSMVNELDIRKLKKGIKIIVAIIGLLYMPAFINYFKVHTGKKFAIYLAETPKSYKGVKNIKLEYFQLQKQPLIREEDISGYDFQENIIHFDPARKTFDAADYIKLIGRVFVVCLGKERIYCGTFWTYAIVHGTGTIIAVPDRQGIKLEPGYFGIGKGTESLIYSVKIRERFARLNKLR